MLENSLKQSLVQEKYTKELQNAYENLNMGYQSLQTQFTSLETDTKNIRTAYSNLKEGYDKLQNLYMALSAENKSLQESLNLLQQFETKIKATKWWMVFGKREK
jgi:predicted nuclease with TOPRIM domain